MLIEKLKTLLNNYTDISLEFKDNIYSIHVNDSIDINVLREFLLNYFKLEKDNLEDLYTIIVKLDLKDLSIYKLKESFKLALSYKDLVDPIMILNIINLIKTYNTLNDSFIENEDIYIKDLTDFIDIKLELRDDLLRFNKELAMYFYSLLKSNNKLNIEDNSDYAVIENIYLLIFKSIDFMTMCGILSVVEDFNTSECAFVKDAKSILDGMLNKSFLGNKLANSILESFNYGITD